MWIYTGNKLAKFHENTLSLSENIAKCFRGGYFFDSDSEVYETKLNKSKTELVTMVIIVLLCKS